MSMTYQDYFIPYVVSDCCYAPMIVTGMCAECYEHCEPIEQEMYPMGIRPIPKFEEDDDEMSSMQQTA